MRKEQFFIAVVFSVIFSNEKNNSEYVCTVTPEMQKAIHITKYILNKMKDDAILVLNDFLKAIEKVFKKDTQSNRTKDIINYIVQKIENKCKISTVNIS